MLASESLNYLKLAGYVLCCAYFLSAALHPYDWHLIDGANLIIHEAGHVIFSPFGSFLNILGGSLLQILIPAMFTAYFWRQKFLISTSVMMLWLGQSIINTSIYIGDAVLTRLPLLGGDTTMHDWNNLLSMIHLLPHATAISRTVFFLGWSIIIGSIIVVSVLALQKQKAQPSAA